MALFVTDKDKLNSAMEATADAIRAKTGGDALIPWDYANDRGFADAIAAIPAGTPPVLENLTVTENGIYTPPTGVDGFSQVIVGVAVRSPRCDQVVTFDWGEYQKHMAWNDGTPEPWPDPPDPPDPLPGPSVSFTSGSDADVAAAIDAANAGTIDLQNGANAWHVGDKRVIHLNSFTGAGNITNAAEDFEIAITSFDEYMGCGNVMQFDFTTCPISDMPLSSTDTSTGGYGATDTYTITLPAMVDALPSWLKTRLKTFSVLASAGGSDLSTIETVTGNKLALRSEIEIFGSRTFSQPGEGSHIAYCSDTSSRLKPNGYGSAALNQGSNYWLRSAYTDTRFCCVLFTGVPANTVPTLGSTGVAPFGCL